MHFKDLQQGELYAVYGMRARLEGAWRDAQGWHAEFSTGRGFKDQEVIHSARGITWSVDGPWEEYKQKREERRAQGRRSVHINKLYREALEPLGLEVNVYSEEIRITGDYEKFEKLLSCINEEGSSALSDLLS